MRWTRRHRKTNDVGVDGEVAWSWLPDAGAKFAKTLARLAGDGGYKARHTEEIAKETVTPSRRECRIVSADLW
jgi:hypothetical protein